MNNVISFNSIQKCEYCKKLLSDNEVVYQAPDLELKTFCSEHCIKLELIKEISDPKVSVRLFINVFRV